MMSQTLPDPFPIDPSRTNLLVAEGAAHSESLDTFGPQSLWGAKRFWLERWSRADEAVSWNVAASEAGRYLVTFMVKARRGERIRLEGPRNSFVLAAPEEGWQRVEAEEPVDLPAGASTITLRLDAPHENANVSIKSIELVPESEKSRIEQSARAFRGDATWMKEAGYGIMVQCGGWSYPPEGEKKPWPSFAGEFDVAAFVEKVDEMGGKFLLWSATWCRFLFPAPIEAIREVLPERVSEHDLIADLIAECRSRGIRFMLYYHFGHGDEEVMLAKGWRPDWIENGWERGAWFEREEKILREIGERYGEGLDAVFLDDGCSWYPADFERLGAAVKAGNPARLVCYNPWVAPSHTPFQDYYCGENFDGRNTPWKTEDGVAVEGPQKGLQLWGCFIFDGPGWGINRPGQKIDPPDAKRWSVEKIVEMTRRLERERYSVAFNLLMYEDGTLGQDSYEMLVEVARRLDRGPLSRDR